MQTLHIILSLISIVGYVATATFAGYAFVRLKRQEEDLSELKVVSARTLTLMMGEHLRASFDALNEMKETLHDLVDDERFEEAEQLRATIVKAERIAMRELERFKESFGEDAVDVKLTNLRRG